MEIGPDGFFLHPWHLQPIPDHGGWDEWPRRCACGYEFDDADFRDLVARVLYRRLDTGEVLTLAEAPAGALWYGDWKSDFDQRGPDGRVLFCRTPGGDWNIDSRARNCAWLDDHAHRCWVRRGTPRDPQGRQPGATALTVGAGSSCAGTGYGFIEDGVLRNCRNH